jgi:para-nitrobenzyl esterase
MVWVHGGGSVGSGCAWPYDDGTAFIRDDVVLVTINYRLGPFGFLYLDELFDEARHTGNLALLDQIAALEWVRDNITAFGGDPDNVTLFGASFGAMCVMTLLGIPAARGLFRRAVAQSGTLMYRKIDAAQRIAQDVLTQVGVRPGDWKALVAVPAQQLVEAGLSVRDPEPRLPQIWRPVVDGITLPDAPTRQVASGHAAGVEVLVGYNADEWRVARFTLPPGTIPTPNLASLFESSSFTPEEVYATYAAARPGATDQDVYAAIESDLLFTMPTIRLAEAQLRHTDRVWMYRFDWPSPILGGMLGAFHGLDIPFTFERYDDPAMLGEDPPQELGRDLHGTVVRFAASGDPNGGTLPHWLPYDLHHRQIMLFTTPCTVVENPRAAIRQLWEHVAL